MNSSRVLVHAIHQKFVMQVRPCCSARRAYGADDLTLTDALILFYVALIEVQIFGDILFAVLNKHVIAVSAVVIGFDNAAIAGCKYWGSFGCCVVCAPVRPRGFVYWVYAARVEVGANPREI